MIENIEIKVPRWKSRTVRDDIYRSVNIFTKAGMPTSIYENQHLFNVRFVVRCLPTTKNHIRMITRWKNIVKGEETNIK